MTDRSQIEIECESWADLVKWLATENFSSWIFRGLPSYHFQPISSLERALKRASVETSMWRDRENAALGFFKDRSRNFASELPADGDLIGWWSMMQHYGAPTRLVDWTVSPFVACFFAFECVVEASDNAALWMMNASACRHPFGSSFPVRRDHTGTVASETHDGSGKLIDRSFPGREITLEKIVRKENELIQTQIYEQREWPVPLAISRPDRRMAAQQACIVCRGSLDAQFSLIEYFEQYCAEMRASEHFQGIKGSGLPIEQIYHAEHYVKKIKLPISWRNDALVSLARMNITADTLFPGLDGVGRTTSLYLETNSPASMRDLLGF